MVKRKGGREMKRLANILLALMLTVSFAGCAGMHSGKVSKEAKVKCPKCGAVFTVEEGRRALEGP
jgi:nitrite reductase/ring-hydroxylating ferredoxin subunit